MISSSGSAVLRIVAVTMRPITTPIATPPSATTTNETDDSTSENVAIPSATAAAARYAMSDEASLMRLSPSRIVTIRRETPSRWKTAVAATASGGATIAPRVSAAARPMPGIEALATSPTATVVNSDEPHREQQDRARVGTEVTDRREVGRREQDRRQEQQEDEVGRELDRGQVRDQTEQDAAEQQQDRLGDAAAGARCSDIATRDDQHEQHELDGPSMAGGSARRGVRAAVGSGWVEAPGQPTATPVRPARAPRARRRRAAPGRRPA